jgi:hypothetical protein
MNMKLVINTQIAENYAAHNGFTGEFHWKYKGGNTYVVDNITPAQKARIEAEGLPTLSALIENNGDYYREYILSACVVADDAAEGEPWETPFRLQYFDGKWIAGRKIVNTTEYGYMRREIESKVETYVMGPAGGRLEYKSTYVLTNGRTATGDDELRAALEEMEDA